MPDPTVPDPPPEPQATPVEKRLPPEVIEAQPAVVVAKVKLPAKRLVDEALRNEAYREVDE